MIDFENLQCLNPLCESIGFDYLYGQTWRVGKLGCRKCEARFYYLNVDCDIDNDSLNEQSMELFPCLITFSKVKNIIKIYKSKDLMREDPSFYFVRNISYSKDNFITIYNEALLIYKKYKLNNFS